MIAGLFEGLTLLQQVLGFVVAVLIVFAPVACWSCLGRLIRLQKEAIAELKILNSQIRNKGRNMD